MAKNRVKNKVRPQNKHLIPFEKGESGNPNGRPLGQKNYATLYREALIKLAKLNDKEPEELELELISKGIMSARGGDYRFYKDVLDRLLGTAVQNVGIKLEPDELTRTKSKDLIKKYLDGRNTN